MARLRVGLTGGIASGKSSVAQRLADYGAVVIDSDLLARDVVAPGTPGLSLIKERFGSSVIATADDGTESLDRPALGQIVFADPAARRDLEAIIHPAVRRRASELEGAADQDAVLIQMIPLLVETGQADAFDVCLVVDVDEVTQLDRLVARDGLTTEQARQRMQAQASRAERLGVADLVIDNAGDLDSLDRQVAAVARRWALLPR